ncbi:MAG: hypothetical protein EBT52_07510 [Flavobacteriia bacterium]|jgi:hypothetical protein|nr:hypothetical protein [Flavobacteriia bacterium]
MTEKDLKKLFQKKFGEREVPYEPSSWSALEQMLDKATPVAWYRRPEIVQKGLVLTSTLAVATSVYLFSPLTENKADTFDPAEAPSIQATPVPETTTFELDAERSEQGGPTEDAREQSSMASSSSSDAGSHLIPERNNRAENRSDGATASNPETLYTSVQLAPVSFDPERYLLLEKKNILNVQMQAPQEELFIEPIAGPSPAPIRDGLSWDIHGLLALGQALSNGGSSESELSAFGLGAGLRWSLTPRLGLETSLNFTRRKDLSMLKTFEGTAYGFGSEQHIAHVVAEQADILDLPISLNVRLGAAHQLKMGYYGAYMMRAINRVEEHRQDMFTGDWAIEERTASGHEDGFRVFDHGLTLGYEWAFAGPFTLGIDYLHGLQDLSRDDVYGAKTRHFNRQARFKVSYQFR